MRHDHNHAKNLLVRLFSYSPREGRSSDEDFCTECLAWLLQHVPDIRNRFLEQIKVTPNAGKWRVSTQVAFSNREEVVDENERGSRFDLVLEPESVSAPVVVVECKIDAPVAGDQIDQYRDDAPRKWHERRIKPRVVLLAKSRHPAVKSHGRVTWKAVHGWCKGHTASDRNGKKNEKLDLAENIVAWFTRLLEVQNMDDKDIPHLPANVESVIKWHELVEFLGVVAQGAAKAGLKQRAPTSKPSGNEAGAWAGASIRLSPPASEGWVGFRLSGKKAPMLEAWVEFVITPGIPTKALLARLTATGSGWKCNHSTGSKAWWGVRKAVHPGEASSISQQWLEDRLKELSTEVKKCGKKSAKR